MTPIRPVSDDHRHEPADYELEPNELAAEAIKRVWQEYNLPVGPTMFRKMADEALTALTQAHRSCCADERERCAKIVEDHAKRDWTASEVFKAIATAIREPTDALPGVGQMTRYKSSNSMGDCQRVCNAMRGTLAAIIADPDCCAASKAIARDALTYHANSTSSDDTSGAGHTPGPWEVEDPLGDGPCAARPIDPLVNVIRHWLMSEDHPVSKWEIEFATAIRSNSHD